MTPNPLFTLAMQAGVHEAAYLDARSTALRANDKAVAANARAQQSARRLAVAILSADPPLNADALTTVISVALGAAAEARPCAPPSPPPLPDGTGRVTVEFIIGPISDH